MARSLFILTPGFPESEFDSTCLPHIQQFCLALKAVSPEMRVTVIAMQYPFRRAVYTWNDMEVHAVGGRNRPGILRLLTWFRTARTLARLHRRYRPQALLSLFLSESAFLGKRFSRRHGLPHLIWLQGQDALRSNAFVARIRPRGTELAAISARNAEDLEKNHGIQAAHLVPNAVNTALFPPMPTNRTIDVLGAGSLIPLKNYEAFIRVVHLLKKKFPSITCCIAGDGPQERELVELAQRLGLQRNLRFLGRQPHEEVLKLMSNSRVFLHPSTYEGLSTVLLEALYSGCGVVSAQPVDQAAVQNFHMVADEDQMAEKVADLLQQAQTPQRVLVHDVRDSARKALAILFPR